MVQTFELSIVVVHRYTGICLTELGQAGAYLGRCRYLNEQRECVPGLLQGLRRWQGLGRGVNV